MPLPTEAPSRTASCSSTARRKTLRSAKLPRTAASQCASHWSVQVWTCTSRAQDQVCPRWDSNPIARSPATFLGKRVPSVRST
eukprot:523794-Pyramimonas_sp.AAC.1